MRRRFIVSITGQVYKPTSHASKTSAMRRIVQILLPSRSTGWSHSRFYDPVLLAADVDLRKALLSLGSFVFIFCF